MAIRIDTRQPSVLFVVLSIIVVLVGVVAHMMGSIPMAPWLKRYDFWIVVIGYAVLLWRVLF